MKGLSIFSLKKVEDEQDKHDDVLQNEKDPSSLETMSAEISSLKSRLRFKEEEVFITEAILSHMLGEIKRLKDTLSDRDLKVGILRADIDRAWQKFDTYLSNTSPERSKNETRHEKEPGEEEIKGMAREEDEIRFRVSILPPAFLGPPLHSCQSKAESDLVGAQCSREAEYF